MRFRALALLLVLFVSSLTLPLLHAQEPTISWDDAPDAPAMRHLGDWMNAAGWYTNEEIYGPFLEEEFEVGDEVEFSPLMGGFDGFTSTYALRYKSEAAYFWFSPGTRVDEKELAAAAQRLDESVLPQIRAIYGDPSPVGIDGDPRFHIIHDDYIDYGAVGVFRPDDQCAKFLCPEGNQRDILYYSLDWAPVNTQEYFTTIAHEYQHLIRYFRDGNERRWMNEGLSQLGEHLAGYAPEFAVGDNLDIFLSNPDSRLDGWADYTMDPGIYYGSSYLFMIYLYERLGLDFIRALAESPLDGLAAVYETIEALESDVHLDGLFGDWLVANYLDDPFVADGRYYYATLTVPPDAYTELLRPVTDRPEQLNRQLNQYGANYFELPEGTYNLLFDGAETAPMSPTTPASGEWMWWSYDAEGAVTSLERSFDLTQVENATLEFDLWYNLESDFDWFDVMVSFDNGLRWKPLSNDEMYESTDRIPVPYFTGSSPGWLHEQIDLTPYVGKEIMIRFETATDGSTSLTGTLIDNIAVPELGFTDDVESTDAGWLAEGFIRVPENVPQNWSLAYIQKGSSPSVQLIPLSSEHIGSMTLNVGEGGGVLVVGAMAPLTGEKASYKMTIEVQ
jgi:immune inhibitor A